MAIADKSFEYQGKRRGEVNTSKDTVPRRAWLATAGILVWEDEGLKYALWICTMQSGEEIMAKDTGNWKG